MLQHDGCAERQLKSQKPKMEEPNMEDMLLAIRLVSEALSIGLGLLCLAITAMGH